jgi:hypothetical protein
MRRPLSPDEWAFERGEIFSRYQQLGIRDEGERHRLQHALIGCPSLRYMTHEEHQKLIETLGHLCQQSYAQRQRTLQGLLTLASFDYETPEFDF